MMRCIVIIAILLGGCEGNYIATSYGVDETFPIHHDLKEKSIGYDTYNNYFDGCVKQYGYKACATTEAQRMNMNLEQPRRQANYTELGFGRIQAPAAAWKPIKSFYDTYKHLAKEEAWPPGNSYVNHWRTPTKMVGFEDPRFQPLGLHTKQAIWDGMQPVLEAWTNQKLKPSSLYGIRIYGNNSILNPHVDRLPLVVSCIMQVDQDVDEPWPLEVISHDGRAFNVTLQPGEVALYESSTIIHARPFPMVGRAFANAFIHFIPVDKNDKYADGIDFDWDKKAKKGIIEDDLLAQRFPKPPPHDDCLERARKASEASVYNPNKLPSNRPAPAPATYISEHKHTSNQHQQTIGKPFNQGPPSNEATGAAPHFLDSATSPTHLHVAAAFDDVKAVLEHVRKNPSDVNAVDENLWTPLHEAARSASPAIARILVSNGADLGAKTIGGATALWIAKSNSNIKLVEYLQDLGAPDIPDEL